MSEIKFACPHCLQHIACDEAYCNERIDCPGCAREMFIPQRAMFISEGNMPLATPIAYKKPPYSHAIAIERLAADELRPFPTKPPHQPLPLLPLWILLFLPFVLMLILVMHRANFIFSESCFILCALLGGFYWAKIRGYSGIRFAAIGLLCSIAMFFAYFVLAIALLFAGCLIVII